MTVDSPRASPKSSRPQELLVDPTWACERSVVRWPRSPEARIAPDGRTIAATSDRSAQLSVGMAVFVAGCSVGAACGRWTLLFLCALMSIPSFMIARTCCRRSHVERRATQDDASRISRPCLSPAPYESQPMVELHKHTWKMVGTFGQRNGMDFAFPPPTINYYDVNARPGVRGHVGLTIDDAPCRSQDVTKSMVVEVQDLLAEFDAKATFFVISDYVPGHEQSIQELLRHGHELGNHGCADIPYNGHSEQDFEEALLAAEAALNDIRVQSGMLSGSVRWFRAPQARLSKAMSKVIHKHGFQNVLCDAYANDPWISDPDFIIQETLAAVQDGSIIVIHMPEEGFREHCYVALKGILAGLKEKGFKPVTLTTLDTLARQWHLRPCRTGLSSAEQPEKIGRRCDAWLW